MAIRHSITLSTSEPNNEVGNLKIRQGDEQTQTLVANITENGVPKPFTGLQPFFCAKLGQTAGLGIIEQKVTGTMNPANGTLEYVMQPEDWQQLGRQTAYFSFRKMVNDHEWTEQFSTRDFNYNVIKSAFSEGLREVKKDGSTYVWTIEDLIRLFNEYISTGKTDWEDFVEQNREILESVDPGGIVLRELLDARKPFGGEAYQTLGERLDEEKNENEKRTKELEETKFSITGGKITKDLYGMKNNACLVNINNDNRDADITGFVDPSEQATYSSKDIVGIFSSIISPKIVNMQIVSFDAYSVEVVDIPQSLKVGSFIEVYDDERYLLENRYSGIVTKIEEANNRIFVSGWFKYGDTNTGQIPNNDVIIANPVRKIWGMNVNTSLKEESLATRSVIGEFGMWAPENENTKKRAAGFDTALFAGVSSYGYQVRKVEANKNQNSYVEVGFLDNKSKIGFHAFAPLEIGFLTTGESNKKGFVGKSAISNMEYFATTGEGRTLRQTPVVTTIDSSFILPKEPVPLYVCTSSAIITLPTPETLGSVTVYTEIVRVASSANIKIQSDVFFNARSETGVVQQYKDYTISDVHKKYTLYYNGISWRILD